MDDNDYYQHWMSKRGFSLLKQDDGEQTRKCIGHNFTQAAS